jgi:hypothetical protein
VSKLTRRRILQGTAVALSSATFGTAQRGADCNCSKAPDGSPLDTGTSELRPVIERYDVDLRDLNRVYPLAGSRTRHERLEKFYGEQLKSMDVIHFDSLSQPGKVDYLLLRDRLVREQRALAAESRQEEDVATLIPFQQTIIGFEEARRRMEIIDPQKTAVAVNKLTGELVAAKAEIAKSAASKDALGRAATRLAQLRGYFRSWHAFYSIYDPRFAWWVDAEYKAADEALEAHAQALHAASGRPGQLEFPAAGGFGGGRGGVGGAAGGGGRGGRGGGAAAGPVGSNEELSGIGPAGNDALVEALRAAMIAYTPDELIQIANKEFAWCEREMLRASNELGFGNDWKKAIEAVKNKYVDPGQMIYLVRDLSHEAIEFIEKHDLVTIPPLVKEDYWEEAMTPQMQLVNPFFTGGATIQVSSPASSQTLQQKLEALRGNNIFFARATVFHELIPGHHMQQYMTQRYRTYRSMFSTAFWTEGMAFYWEMLLWDLGFTKTPEQRIGALVWRTHRCARIVFSLSFHLKKMTAVECVALLMDRVGFDRANAEGEVRRSFNGSYPPIYQCAYMLGALQFYSLHKELVGSGKMTNRAFHDAIYREGNIPIEMLRLALTGQKVSRDYQTSWKFYGAA